MKQMPPKDPSDVQDYTRDASAFLGTGQAIATSTWTVEGPDAALLIGTGSYAASNDGTTATVWLSAGTEHAEYTVRNVIVTDSTPPRTKALSFVVKVLGR